MEDKLAQKTRTVVRVDEKIQSVIEWKKKYPQISISSESEVEKYFKQIARNEKEYKTLMDEYVKIKSYYTYINSRNLTGKLSEEQQNQLKEGRINYKKYGYPKVIEEISEKLQISKEKAKDIICEFGTLKNMTDFVKRLQTMSNDEIENVDNAQKIRTINAVLKENLITSIDLRNSQYEKNYRKLMYDLYGIDIKNIILYDSNNIIDAIQQSCNKARKNSLINYYGLQDGEMKTFKKVANEEHLTAEGLRGRVNRELKILRNDKETKIINKYTIKDILNKISEKEEEISYIQEEVLPIIRSKIIEEINIKELISEKSDISELELPIKSYNCLKRSRIDKIEDLEGVNLIKLRNLGRKKFQDILDKCEEKGLPYKIDEEGGFHILPRDPMEIRRYEEEKARQIAIIEEKNNLYRRTETEQYLAHIENLKKEIEELKEQQKIFEQYIDDCRFIAPDKDYVKDDMTNVQQIDNLLQQINEIDELFAETSQQVEEEKEKAKQNKLLRKQKQKDEQNIIDT